MAKYNSFEEMKVYQQAVTFALEIYKLSQENTSLLKDFGIKDQLKRAALSISNNIAEGFERETKKELIRFLYFSKGSAGECRNILHVLHHLDFIKIEEYESLRMQVFDISQQLGNYIKYLKKLEEKL